MNFTEEEIQEFKTEAIELLDGAEKELLGIESDGNFQTHYDAIFRVFHSLKGGAGMLGMTALQEHMHSVESIFSKLKGEKTLDKTGVSFFLKAVDASRHVLSGEKISFDYDLKKESAAKPAPPAPPPVKIETKHPISPQKGKSDSLPTISNAPVVYAIDDEPEILALLKEVLEGSKIQCQIFDSPLKGLEAVKAHPPSALLVDLKMPVMDGVQVLREARKFDPDLPVIFVSGYLDKSILMECIEHGAFAAIEKPFESKNLLTHVFNAVRFRALSKLLSRSVNLLLYQFSDLDKFLEQHGKDDIRKAIRTEMEVIIENRKGLKHLLRSMA